jgi:multisubunit Na+/H+ antiporter MnhC subunit
MNIVHLVAISALSLFGIGLYGLWSGRNVLRWILAVGLMETGINVFLVLTGWRPGGTAPIITETFSTSGPLPFVDPVPSALVLTSIVIGLGTTTLALSLAILHGRAHGTLECDADPETAEVIE